MTTHAAGAIIIPHFLTIKHQTLSRCSTIWFHARSFQIGHNVSGDVRHTPSCAASASWIQAQFVGPRPYDWIKVWKEAISSTIDNRARWPPFVKVFVRTIALITWPGCGVSKSSGPDPSPTHKSVPNNAIIYYIWTCNSTELFTNMKWIMTVYL